MINNKIYILTILICIFLGMIFTLFFRVLRYTDYVYPYINEIDPILAYENITSNRDNIIFIDVRSEGEYAQSHASGSVNLPIHYMYDDMNGLKNEKGVSLPKNTKKEIYLICTGGRLAGVAYSYLEHYGYRNIKRVEGGMSNWNTKGLPFVTKSIFNNEYKEKSFVTPSLDRPYVQ